MIRLPRRSTLFPYTTLFRSTGVRLDRQTATEGFGAVGDAAEAGAVRVGAAAAVVGDPHSQHPVLSGEHQVDPVRRSEEHTSELQSQSKLVCRLLREKKKNPA